MNGSLLFGFDLFAIAVALWKLITVEFFPRLSEGIKRVLLACLMTGVTVMIGLQTMGLIFPPESEPIVTLCLTALMAFLTTMGYGLEVASMIRAGVDLVRLSAVALWVSTAGVAGEDDIQYHNTTRVLGRYRLHK